MDDEMKLKLQLKYEAEIKKEIFTDILEKYLYLCKKNMDKKMQEYNAFKSYNLQVKH